MTTDTTEKSLEEFRLEDVLACNPGHAGHILECTRTTLGNRYKAAQLRAGPDGVSSPPSKVGTTRTERSGCLFVAVRYGEAVFRRSPLRLAAVLLGALALAGLLVFTLTGARERSRLYCVEQKGQLWGGEAGPLPVGLTPRCPDSNSYRAEVRRGTARVEQYMTPGWHPKLLQVPLLDAGYTLLTGELINPGLYEAFLEKPGRRVYYLASREGSATLFTLSGRP